MLAYAAGLDASLVVWVAPAFREEHRKTIDWLNENKRLNIITIEDPIEILHIDKKCIVHQREIGTFTYSYAVVRDTEKEAREYWDYYVNQKGDWEAADNICKIFGVESGSYSPDYMDKFRRNFIAGWGGYPLVGTPEQVTDRIEKITGSGIVTGLAVHNGRLYAVSDNGGLYVVNNPTSSTAHTCTE